MKIYFGIGILLVILIVATIFQVIRDQNEIATIKKQSIAITTNTTSQENPPIAESGYNWVWHDNHWDKVKITETDNLLDNLHPIPIIPEVHQKSIALSNDKDFNDISIPKREDYDSDTAYIIALDTTADEISKLAKSLLEIDPKTSIKLNLISINLANESQQLKQSTWRKFLQKYPVNAEPPVNSDNPLIDNPPIIQTDTKTESENQ